MMRNYVQKTARGADRNRYIKEDLKQAVDDAKMEIEHCVEHPNFILSKDFFETLRKTVLEEGLMAENGEPSRG